MAEERRGARSIARECALMMLFGLEASGEDPQSAARDFFAGLAGDAGLTTDDDARAYAREIATGVRGSVDRIDETIRKASEHWRIERMSRVDRNVLRIGAWELQQGVPRAVTIDEAVELAKRFGTAESGSFVNGILDRVAENLGIR
ncbi:MAG: transcription antitermination factor NusB [Myxococcales bacterium]|nr:transcription antitermination factor NusB [Myxococcales bacterium]